MNLSRFSLFSSPCLRKSGGFSTRRKLSTLFSLMASHPVPLISTSFPFLLPFGSGLHVFPRFHFFRFLPKFSFSLRLLLARYNLPFFPGNLILTADHLLPVPSARMSVQRSVNFLLSCPPFSSEFQSSFPAYLFFPCLVPRAVPLFYSRPLC